MREAAAIDPQRSPIHFLLMQTYAALHDPQRSREELALYQRFAPDFDASRRLAGQYRAAHPEVREEESHHEHGSIPLAPTARSGSSAPGGR